LAFDGPLEESIDDDLCKAIFCACPSAIEVVFGRRLREIKTFKNGNTLVCNFLKGRVSELSMLWTSWLHDIAEQFLSCLVVRYGGRRHCVKRRSIRPSENRSSCGRSGMFARTACLTTRFNHVAARLEHVDVVARHHVHIEVLCPQEGRH
jgi:hypothetical protein